MRSRVLTVLILLWLSGVGLRLTILAVPPVIPLIHRDLALTETEVGLLASLPVALFALAALPGSLLIARLGATATLVTGLAVAALGSGLRGASASVALLYVATILMGAGVAVMQPAMPIVVRDWLPRRIGFGTAIYSNGLVIGEIVPVMLTIPVVLPLAGGSWRTDLVVWSLPVLVTAAVVAAFAPRAAGAAAGVAMPISRWWPDWRKPLTWQLGMLLACVTSIYFGANAFIPDYLIARGRPDLVGGALTALNIGQLPGSFALLVLAQRLERRAAPFVLSGMLGVLGVAGMIAAVNAWMLLWAGLLGFMCGTAMILCLTLPALLGPPEEVARLAAAMFALGYGVAPVVAVVSGAAWDLAGVPQLAFVPMGLCSLALVTSALVLRAKGRLR